MVNFYIKGMSTTEEEQKTIINNFKKKKIDVIPIIDDYSNYSIKTIFPYIEKFIKDHNPNDEEINLICHSMGCNFGYLFNKGNNVNKLILVSPEFIGTDKKQKKEIVSNYDGIDYNTSNNPIKPNLHNMILYYQSLRNVVKIQNMAPSLDTNSLVIYSKGDPFVNQYWINSDINLLSQTFEVNSNSHNPLLTNDETYDEIAKFIKEPLEKIK